MKEKGKVSLMRISSTAKYALGVTAAAAMLAGCSSGASSLAPTTPTMGAQGIHHQVSTLISHVGQVVPNINHGPSWMNPDAKTKQFLYVSDAGAGTVQVYAWPKPKSAVGTLTGFSEPQGLCADSSGNIFVANTEGLNILEYKAGGKSPIATIPDPDGFPAGCSIDSKGNLAVSNIINASGGTPGNLDIYKGTKGTPTKHTSSVLLEDFFVGFDKAGNAWVSGINSSGVAGFTEFNKKGKEVTGTISGATIEFPGSTEFDGKVMTTGDQEGAVAYQLKKYKVTGSTPLSGQSDIVQYWIDQPTSLLIGPDAGNVNVEIYKYPAGGSPTQTLSGGFSQPIGATVSAK